MNPIPSSINYHSELMRLLPSPRGVRAAREFEASLIASLIESLETTWAALPGQAGLPGEDNYGYLGTQALASGVAARGGFGIAALIEKDLARHEGKGAHSIERSVGGQGQV